MRCTVVLNNKHIQAFKSWFPSENLGPENLVTLSFFNQHYSCFYLSGSPFYVIEFSLTYSVCPFQSISHHNKNVMWSHENVYEWHTTRHFTHFKLCKFQSMASAPLLVLVVQQKMKSSCLLWRNFRFLSRLQFGEVWENKDQCLGSVTSHTWCRLKMLHKLK